MTKLKTLKELEYEETYSKNMTIEDSECNERDLTSDELKIFHLGIRCANIRNKKEAIRWIKALEKKSLEHWKKLDEYGFSKFPETKDEDCYGFQFQGEYFYCWQEENDVRGSISILKLLYDIGNL